MLGANCEVLVHRYTPGARDARGNKTAVWTPAEQWVEANLFIRRSNAVVEGVVTTVRDMVCRLPAGVAVSDRDVIEDRDGTRYRVATVDRRRTYTGRVWHITCTLEEDSTSGPQ